MRKQAPDAEAQRAAERLHTLCRDEAATMVCKIKVLRLPGNLTSVALTIIANQIIRTAVEMERKSG